MSSSKTNSASDADPSKIALLKDALYDAMIDSAAGDANARFDQEDLMGLKITNDLHMLLQLIQGLMTDKLLLPFNRTGGGTVWGYRSVADATKYRTLNREQSMVYEMVEGAGADGIWSRTLKARLGFHDSVLKTHLKFLESKNYVSEMKSVEHPNKKMYIKAGLRPSDRAAGGSWYTDGELDEAFISELLKFVFDYVTQQSTYRHIESAPSRKKEPKKGVLKGDGAMSAKAKGKKRAADDMSTEDPAPKPATASSKKQTPREPKQVQLLPLPAGYNGYPTTRQIAQFIAGTNITETTLTIPDVQQLVDVLVYDGLLEPIEASSASKPPRYRTVRPLATDPTPMTAMMRDSSIMDMEVLDLGVADMGAHPLSNGLTEAPCGNCPVFELCEEGGPVSPGSCVYFQRWLGD